MTTKQRYEAKLERLNKRYDKNLKINLPKHLTK